MYDKNRLYSKEHEWIEIRDDVVVLGITDFAQRELGEVVFVELPEVGDRFEAHDEIGTVESVKAVAEVYTPVGGEVVAVNESITDSPELLNEDPHDRGWLIRLRLTDRSELESLMSAEQYEQFVATVET